MADMRRPIKSCPRPDWCFGGRATCLREPFSPITSSLRLRRSSPSPTKALLGAVGATAFAPPYAVLEYRNFAALIRGTAARPDIRNYSAWAEDNVPLLDFPDDDIQTALYTQEDQWLLQQKYPIVFSDASADLVTADLATGHAFVGT